MPGTTFSRRTTVLLCAFLFIILPACKQKTEGLVNLPPEQLAQFVSGYSSGVIGKNEPILVQFSKAVVAEDEVGTTVNKSWYNLSPGTNATAVWQNNSTLKISPEDRWEQGQTYELRVKLSKVFPSDNVAQDFHTSVSIRKTELEIIVDGLYTPNEAEAAQQELFGQINSNDDISQLDLQKIFQASQPGSKLNVIVTPNPDDANSAEFRVTGINRKDAASELKFNWDASRIKGIGDSKGERTLTVSSINDFRIVKVFPKSDDGDYIEIIFTDPVDRNQDLNGLITLSGTIQIRLTASSNRVRIDYPDEMDGEQTVNIDASVRNRRGIQLGLDSKWDISFSRPDPQLRAVSDGAIMPHTGQRLFPFEAIGLEAVRLEIFKIFSNNVQQFLAEKSLNGKQYIYGLDQVGRIIHQEKIMLKSLNGSVRELDNWNRFAIDLSKFIEDDDKAIYQVRIGFALEDARKECDKTEADFGIDHIPGNGEEPKYIGFDGQPKTVMGNYYGIYGESYDDYSWRNRDNACNPAYYNSDRFLSRNVLCSNLGLIVKQNNDRQTVVIVTDLISGGPKEGANITLYDEQQQKLTTGTSDVDGRWIVETSQQPMFVSAKQGNDVAYLRLNQNNALNTSRFATSGKAVAAGVKGTFYAERGVWRPGDSIYLNFVLENQLLKLPVDYPIKFTLTDPKGAVRERRVVQSAAGQIYPLNIKTDADDPTGNWVATVNAGGKSYTKYLKVETIKPNRLKVNLEPVASGPLTRLNNVLNIRSNWLHGAPAANLRATVMGQLQENPDAYAEKWNGYIFNDPARRIFRSEEVYFDGQLSGEGTSSFKLQNLSGKLSGPMRIAFSTRVFENGGDFSSDNVRFDLVNYKSLAGISLPTNNWGSKRLPMNTNSDVSLVAIDADGKGLSNRKLEVGLYKVKWRYWWQDENDNVSRFNSSSHKDALESYKVTTASDGRALVKVKVESWGRYLLRVCDTESGHCSGDYFYAGSPRWTESDKDAAAMLPLRIEDKKYKIGESAAITVNSEQGGMLLLSLENDEGVIETRWIQASKGETNIPVKLDERMLPTVYASVMLIQPHAETKGGRPIRQYGIVPIQVEDPATRLQPTIATAAEYEPEEKFSVTVAEQNGQEMNYTLAIVDEGLLGLTRFKTPDLWSDFFGKEALCVRTYDLYNDVIGSMDGQFNRILAVGGDGENGPNTDKAKANRFEPVVMHVGPFKLRAGKKATHNFTMPNYVGAVRVMVVAEGNRKYGKADESIPVRKDLMVLPTLPRVVSPGESIELPVNVFAMTGKVKDVKVRVEEKSGLVTSEVANTRAIRFDAPGDQLVRFPFRVGNETGVARFVVSASGNGESISQEIEIQVENPNAVETRTEHFTLDPGETRIINYQPFGTSDTRSIQLEASHLPSLNLDKHLNYLIRYPYGCAEQTTSALFPQLHLNKLVELNPKRQQEIRNNIKAGLQKLQRFQNSNGGIGYWRGDNNSNPWASNYVLNALLEAEAAGYALPIGMKQKLIDYQKKSSSSWRKSDTNGYYYSHQQREYDQAYRLYTLALAGQPNTGAMNRLRGEKKLNATTRSLLAAAYALIGKTSVADELINSGDRSVKAYRELGYTFGSSIRDRALMLMTYQEMGKKDLCGKLALELAKEVNQRNYLSTQEGAFMITAMAKYLDNQQVATGQGVQLVYTAAGGSATELGSNRGLVMLELPVSNSTQSFELKNNGKAQIYATLSNSARPLPGEETAVSKGLALNVKYTDLDGNPIDVSSLKCGTDFVATYSVESGDVRYRTLKNLALQQIAASGWEISNERMGLMKQDNPEDHDKDWDTSNSYDYRDFRDDRVNTFFSMNRGSKNVFRLRMTAAYAGRYYLPTQLVEAMYDPEIRGSAKGRWVEVVQ